MSDEPTDTEKPTPAVPPEDFIPLPEKQTGSRVLESTRVDSCDCGGDVVEEEVATGRWMLAVWSDDYFDREEYALSEEIERTERRVRCDRCGMGWSF